MNRGHFCAYIYSYKSTLIRDQNYYINSKNTKFTLRALSIFHGPYITQFFIFERVYTLHIKLLMSTENGCHVQFLIKTNEKKINDFSF